MSDLTPDTDDQATDQTDANAAAEIITPSEQPKPDPEPEHKADPKKPVDKALAAAAKAAKIKVEDVLAFKDYDDKLIVITRAGQKVVVPK